MIYPINSNAFNIPLRDKSVQCVVTSPPYWGLRDYGTATWEGGSAECDHSPARKNPNSGTTVDGGTGNNGHIHEGFKGDICPRCGARRIDAQIGLESTPAAYVAHIVAVMRECWRVLKDDGVLWLNLGDSYATTQAGSTGTHSTLTATGKHPAQEESFKIAGSFDKLKASGLKPKDLCGIPWRVAFALQDDGWYLRSDIIWAKPNPMPESVTDRPTKAHEYVFLLTKQARYYYDAEAIKETASTPIDSTARQSFGGPKLDDSIKAHAANNGKAYRDERDGSRNRRSVWTIATSPYSGKTNFTCPECGGTGYQNGQLAEQTMSLKALTDWFANDALPCPACNGSGEQSTNVDHFATFPPALIEPMILAGTSARGECPHCGKAWVRVVERKNGDRTDKQTPKHEMLNQGGYGKSSHPPGWRKMIDDQSVSIGWRQQCDCPPHDPIPQTVLDPFAGSGTTGAVAVQHGRKAVLLDLNTKYIDLQFDRTSAIQITMPV